MFSLTKFSLAISSIVVSCRCCSFAIRSNTFDSN
uniref:Zinc finger protein n=1 Tax=Siphoviridae sp. ctE6L85 TaxID=2826202 RepID=A0A8S5QRM2_9CAUD|nr:MAG TPA: zinc finger protein [Siphoviridae sp. ctE6L85]